MTKMIAFVLACCCLAVCSRPLPAEDYLTQEEALNLAFPDADSVESKQVLIAGETRKAIAKLTRAKELQGTYEYYFGVKNDKAATYAVIAEVLGKHQPITFMVVFDANAAILSVEILSYREAYGGEIRQESFRKQYEGKTADDAIKLKDDIKNVSGATISCHNLSEGVHETACYMSVLIAEHQKTLQQAADKQPEQSIQSVSRSQLLMGTTLTITVYAQSKDAGNAAITAAFDEVARLDKILSTYKIDSEVSRINQAAGLFSVAVSADSLQLLRLSKEVHGATSGAFDITVGPVVELWKKAQTDKRMPTAEDICNTASLIDMASIETDEIKSLVRLAKAGMALDFGGIGKGYALDRAAAVLKARGIEAALLNFGGNVLATAPPPGQDAWEIPLRSAGDDTKADSLLHIKSGSIAATADYERGLQIDGKRVSHIIDPRTGKPVEGMLQAVCCAPTAVEADAYSTALYVLGIENGRKFATDKKLCILLQAADDTSWMTDDFKALLD